jgi:hypothetical protein
MFAEATETMKHQAEEWLFCRLKKRTLREKTDLTRWNLFQVK